MRETIFGKQGSEYGTPVYQKQLITSVPFLVRTAYQHRLKEPSHRKINLTPNAPYFTLSQIKILLIGFPSGVVVLNLIVSLSPEIEKFLRMLFPMSPGNSALSR